MDRQTTEPDLEARYRCARRAPGPRPCSSGGNKIDLSGLATGNDLAAEAKISKAFGEIINDGRIAHVQIIRSRADARDADDFVKTIEQLGCAVDHDSWESEFRPVQTVWL